MRYEQKTELWKMLREIWRKHGDPIRYGSILDTLLLPILVIRKRRYYVVYDPAVDEIEIHKRKELLMNYCREVWIIKEGMKIEKLPFLSRKFPIPVVS